MIKKIQQKFSEEEWSFLKKYHKRSRASSKISSTISYKSQDEEMKASETSSVASGKKSNTSSNQGKRQKRYQRKVTEEDEIMRMEDEAHDCAAREAHSGIKKVVHFNNKGHIELKDLKEKDFLDLIEAKN